MEETRVALVGIIVSDTGVSGQINEILHEYGAYMIGRMGEPYRKKGISIISVAVDAPQKDISALAGKLGMLPGVSTKTIYQKI